MKIYRAYKFRLYPINEQRILIHKTFGCSRFVYNYYLNYQKENGVQKAFNLCKDLKELENNHEYLKEVDSCALRCSIFDLEDGFNNFFAKRSGYPIFKSKFARQSYRTSCIRSTYKGKEYSNIEVDLQTRFIKLPKLGKVKIRGFRDKDKIEGKIVNATISKETTNKYYISINAKNNKGVIGKIGTICAENDISLASIVQKCVSEDNTADITVITELVKEKNMQNAIKLIEQDGNTVENIIRVQV